MFAGGLLHRVVHIILRCCCHPCQSALDPVLSFPNRVSYTRYIHICSHLFPASPPVPPRDLLPLLAPPNRLSLTGKGVRGRWWPRVGSSAGLAQRPRLRPRQIWQQDGHRGLRPQRRARRSTDVTMRLKRTHGVTTQLCNRVEMVYLTHVALVGRCFRGVRNILSSSA